MTYSVDFRNKVVAFVRNGGGQAQAARQFDISMWCVRDWLARKDLRPQQKGVPRQRKLDKEPYANMCGTTPMPCCVNGRCISAYI